MIQFKHIVLATDFSDNSEAATPYAMALAKAFGATIYLLNAWEDVPYIRADEMGIGTGTIVDPTVWEGVRKQAKLRLEETAQALSKQNAVPVVPVFREGKAVHVIQAYIDETKPDCIVIATHGRTGLSHLLMGSVAEKIVRHSSCPVFTVRSSAVVEPSHK
jgi:nucleotide-binding universal stress UspA family protein